jgi:hypothetical protein
MTAYAAEIQPEKKPPLYEDVKDFLDEDEVVPASNPDTTFLKLPFFFMLRSSLS